MVCYSETGYSLLGKLRFVIVNLVIVNLVIVCYSFFGYKLFLNSKILRKITPFLVNSIFSIYGNFEFGKL
jgi:hypothetical protein